MCGAAAYLGAHRLTVELRFMHRAFSTARELTVNPQLAVRQSNFHESGVVEFAESCCGSCFQHPEPATFKSTSA
jgi:hypothetical protein